jgi:spore germination cell wall hydrolase CwlJ-like protein
MTLPCFAYKSTTSKFDCKKSKYHAYDDTYALACGMFHESHTDGFEAAVLTGLVIKNRRDVQEKEFKNQDTYRRVVWKRNGQGTPQFSWIDKSNLTVPGDEMTRYLLAAEVIDSGLLDFMLPKNVLWFHNKQMSTKWSRHLKRYKVVGSHVLFYPRNEPLKKVEPLITKETFITIFTILV